MKEIKTNKGITLVALIITIVILLILAAVAINSIQNNGILEYAQNAEKQYGVAQNNEAEILNKTESWLEVHTQGWSQEGNTIKLGETTLTVGEIVGYDETNNGTITGLTDVEWKVLGSENGELLLVSTTDIGTLALDGQDGYFNGIKYLNDMCASYGKGKGANGARSININDINKITGYSPLNTGAGRVYGVEADGTRQIYEYMNVVTFSIDATTNKAKYEGANGATATGSSSFVYLNEATNKFEKFTSANNGLEVTSTYYNYFPTTLTSSDSDSQIGLSTSSDSYKLLFRNTDNTADASYWLADTFVRVLAGYTIWGMRSIYEAEVQKDYLIYTDNSTSGATRGVRAVVRIAPTANIAANESGVLEIL